MQPNDLPPTDLDSMNRDHADQVEMMNAVVAAIEAHDGSDAAHEAVDEALGDFAAHTREHFSQEDDQMRRFQFPAFTMHVDAHTHALERMQAVLDDWASKRELAPLSAYVREEFPAWLVHHVSAMDTVAAQFVSGNAH